MRQEDYCEFEASLLYRVISCLKNKNLKNKNLTRGVREVAGQMVQWLRTVAEDRNPAPVSGSSQPPVTIVPGDLTDLSWPLWAPIHTWHTHK